MNLRTQHQESWPGGRMQLLFPPFLSFQTPLLSPMSGSKKRKHSDVDNESQESFTKTKEAHVRKVEDRLVLSTDRWISQVTGVFRSFDFLKELAHLIIQYGRLTLSCDLFRVLYGNRFVLIEPAAIGAPYGDLSAKWLVLSRKPH